MVCQLNQIRVIRAPMINAPRVPIISNYFQDDGYSTDTSSDDGARSLPELTILLKPICSIRLPARSGVMFQISSP